MAQTIRLTMAQALVKFLSAQKIEIDGVVQPLFHGVFAIFGHGNVAGLGEALYQAQQALPTYRAHNEQGMAHAAIAFAKAHKRQRMMACTTSIGPGAANMITAAALAHANRLPVLFLPGDTFANRTPDPVLQQLEHFGDPGISTNDCFRPVSRYFDRITRPEQIIHSLPAAMQILLDPENCGPATLALAQDVQTEAFDYPAHFFEEKVHRITRQPPEDFALQEVVDVLKKSTRPLLIAGGGVHYSRAFNALKTFCDAHGVPVSETQAGKGSLAWDHPNSVGGIGVTGTAAANQLVQSSDCIIAVGTRLQDFTTASRTLFEDKTLVQINIGRFDAHKHGALPLQADAQQALTALHNSLDGWQSESTWMPKVKTLSEEWDAHYDTVTSANDAPKTQTDLPSDAQVLGAVKRNSDKTDVVVCAAGGLPSELHKLWRCDDTSSYHVEYGYSCMGYEIAGGLGVKMALPEREVFVVVGDGSYMMLNSELATSVMIGKKIIVVVLDNRGFACINRLQHASGGAGFNNLLDDCLSTEAGAPTIDFAAHAKAMGADAEKVASIEALEQALVRAKAASNSYVVCIETDPYQTTAGGTWWDVAIPQVSQRAEVIDSHENYLKKKKDQPY